MEIENENRELQIRKEFCTNLIQELNGMSADIRHSVIDLKSTRKEDIAVAENSHKLLQWRRIYLNEQNTKNLLIYSDSIIKVYNQTFGPVGRFEQLIFAKKNLQNNPDSLAHLNLLFWTLETEMDLQARNCGLIGCGIIICRSNSIETFVSKKVGEVGDTVYFSFEIPKFERDSLKLNFNKIKIINEKSNQKIPFKVINSGPFFFIQTIAKEEGNYILSGQIHGKQYSGFEWDVYVANEFTIKLSQ
jgi:hypothetical protein